MGSTTPSQGLRFPWVDDVISESAQGNLGADVATKLTAQDTARALVIQRPWTLIFSNGQATADGVDTAMTWSGFTLDPYSLTNFGTFPTRVTPGSSYVGLWKYTLQVSFAIGSTITKLKVSVAVTGTTKSYRTFFTNANSGGVYNLSGMQRIPAGTDYFEFKVLHNGGGSQSISTAKAVLWRASA